MQEINRPNRSPQRDRQEVLEKATDSTRTPNRVAPNRHLDRQWSACSLCSVDSIDTDEQLPIPGRESHTGDMAQFMSHIRRLGMVKRFEGDPPFSLPFWKFIKDVLDTAVPVGYKELQDTGAVQSKKPEDNTAFLRKITSTSIVNPIDPGAIAGKTGLTVDEVLTELFYATQMNMLRMRWFPDCELAGINTCSSKRPRKKKKAYCSGCKYRNAIAVLKKIKVVFCFNPDIFFALAEMSPRINLKSEGSELVAVVPATFTGSGYRYSLGCGGDMEMRPKLEAGRYTIKCPIAMSSAFLEVERDATKEDMPHVLRIHVSDMLHRSGRLNKPLTVPHGKIHLDIFTDTQSFFICKIQRANQDGDGTLTPPPRQHATTPFIHAQQVMDHPTYITLFEGTEVETFHFNSAVKQMSLEPATGSPAEKEIIKSMKALSCVNDEILSVAEDESVNASIRLNEQR